ncbi:PAS domain S-box protein [Pontibacter beigongshangensis]|uniref:PAS domain S-box protein n=1 Tax=Pontibacter beigongshangensis TaxID=2574733 RepID=UPI00164EDBEC|nr:PAS domain S-box protein [Pontibacter beigongshangensis]
MKIDRRKGVLERAVEYSLDLVCALDKEGRIYQVNESCKYVLGYEREEMENRSFLSFIHPRDYEASRAFAKDLHNTRKKGYFENCYLSKYGQEVLLQWSTVWSEEDELYFCIGRDITKEKREQQRLREKDELHRSLIEHGADMLALLDEHGNYLYVSDSTEKALGYAPEQMVGQNALSYIHPDDLAFAQASLAEVPLKGCVKVSDFRFKAADGQWRWVETVVSDQLQNPAIRAFTVSSRDITEKKVNSIKLLESEQRFRSMFENNPDLVFFENAHGEILDVNPAVLLTFGIEKTDLVGRCIFDLLSPEVKEVCQQKLQDACEGKLTRFEIETAISGSGPSDARVLDITKIPVKVGAEVAGVYSIVKDVTEIVHSQEIIAQQARKLKIIFESITNAFFTLNKNWEFTHVNTEFEQILGISRQECLGQNIWDLFPEEVGGEFYRQYHKAVETAETAHFEAFLEKKGKWLEATAYPSEEGLAVYFSEITHRVQAEQELKRLSLVASKTTNGVIIMDARGRIEWINEAFKKFSGYTQEEVQGQIPGELLSGPESDMGAIEELKYKLTRAEPVTMELINYLKSGEKRWVLVEITPVKDNHGKVLHFIVIQTDITERKEVEERQLKMTRDLYKQNRDLQQFTYMVSHNLRAPVANAMGLARLLSRVGKNDPTFDKGLENLKTSVSQLDTVLKDVNMILSIRDSKEEVEKEPVELLTIYQQALDNLGEQLEKCGGKICIAIEEGFSLVANRAYLFSIFYNLLSNAIKYRSEVRPLQIKISCYLSKDKGTVISISDNGSGMDMKRVNNDIFNLYSRFHPGIAGRGIGLFLVKSHIEAMGGTIEVGSEVEVGTHFVINLN